MGEGLRKWQKEGKEEAWQLLWRGGCPRGASSALGACSCQAGVSIFSLFFPLFRISIDVMFELFKSQLPCSFQILFLV